MASNIKASIEKINEVSRQLLSRIMSMQVNLQSLENNSLVENIESQPSDKELTNLVSTRHLLITQLFEQNNAEEISAQTTLLQEMLTLDSKLATNSALCKQAVAEQVIKLKKSKKVTKSYQKY